MENEQTSTYGRRDVLKKSAVAAAAAWSAPLIVSSKVGASSGGTCPDVACETWYIVKIDSVGGVCNNSFPDNKGFTGCQTLLEQNLPSPAPALHGGCTLVSVSGTRSDWLQIKLPVGFQVKFALQKQGSGCIGTCRGDYVCDNEGARTYTFDGCGTYSNMIIVFCGPSGASGPFVDPYTAFVAPPESQPLVAAEPAPPSDAVAPPSDAVAPAPAP